jgi:hypothetical protein
MPSLSDDDEEEIEPITYLRRNPDPSLNYCMGVAFPQVREGTQHCTYLDR